MTGNPPASDPPRPDPTEEEPEGSASAGAPTLPTPVRVLMQAGGDSPAAPSAADTVGRETVAREPAREFRVGDELWWVRTAGSTRSGTGSDSGAPLLLLTFARDPGAGTPLRETMAVATDLDQLSDEDLADHFQRSREFRPGSVRSE